jgi:hypothetical protein
MTCDGTAEEKQQKRKLKLIHGPGEVSGTRARTSGMIMPYRRRRRQREAG